MIKHVTRQQLVALVADCDKRFPQEGCGFIVGGQVMPCKNINADPINHFTIAAEDYAIAEKAGNIECIYHSHTNERDGFSPADAKACKYSNIPWLVYNCNSKNWTYADPRGDQPYVGREWIYGINDCYSLTRDFYRREFNIILDDFDRGEDGEWADLNWNMFLQNYKQQGFVDIEDIEQKGDIVLMKIGARWPNHFAVAKGDGLKLYHHYVNRLSCEGVYGRYWRQFTAKVLRHRRLMK